MLFNIVSVWGIHPIPAFRNTSLGMTLNANTSLSHVEQVFPLPLPQHPPPCAWSAPGL